MTDCIFCKIVAGDIPASIVYEDQEVLAFLDISQVTKGHTLLIPKTHHRNLLDMAPHQAQALFEQVPRLSRHLKEKLGAKGVNLISNMEEEAGQTVFHTHLHLLPRYDETDGLSIRFETNEPDFAALGQLAADLYVGENV